MMIKERPILFSAPMVRALLDGSKTQTRRVVNQKHLPWLENSVLNFLDGKWNQRPLPYGKPGDRLWVRETFAHGIQALAAMRDEDGPFVYAATDPAQTRLQDKWKPSIFMPRAASRITLEITSVRVERLQDISEADCWLEGAVKKHPRPPSFYPVVGVDGLGYLSPIGAFAKLWESINGPGSWEANPWVWCISFKVIK